MRAVNGFLENGRFTPLGVTTLPRKVQAVLVFNDTNFDEDKAGRMAWLKRFHDSLKDAADEEMPEFPRASFKRELVDLSDEG